MLWQSLSLSYPITIACPHTPNPSRGSHKLWITLELQTGWPGQLTGSIWHRPALESPPRGSRSNTTSGRLQTTSGQDPITFTRSIPKGGSGQVLEPAEANSASCGQHLHSLSYTLVGFYPHSQPAWGSTPCRNRPTAIKSQPQQKSSHNPHKIHSWSTQLTWLERLCHWVHRTPTI